MPLFIYIMESELVSGFLTEHAALPFVLFFLAEYASIVLMSALTSILFLGGFLLPFSSLTSISSIVLEGFISGLSLGIKTCFIIFGFVWVRASFPRIRFDQLMTVCWTVLLPLVFAFIFLVPCILIAFSAVPTNITLLFLPGLFVANKNLGLFNNKPKPFFFQIFTKIKQFKDCITILPRPQIISINRRAALLNDRLLKNTHGSSLISKTLLIKILS